MRFRRRIPPPRFSLMQRRLFAMFFFALILVSASVVTYRLLDSDPASAHTSGHDDTSVLSLNNGGTYDYTGIEDSPNWDPNWLLDGIYADETGWDDNGYTESNKSTIDRWFNGSWVNWFHTDAGWPEELSNPTGIKQRIKYQKPSLLAGNDGTGSDYYGGVGSLGGFNKILTYFHLLVPKGVRSVTVQTYDLCHSFWDGHVDYKVDQNGDREGDETILYIGGRGRSEILLDSGVGEYTCNNVDNNMNDPNSYNRPQLQEYVIDLDDPGMPGHDRTVKYPDRINSHVTGEYEQYLLYIEARFTGRYTNSRYYNNFRLKVSDPSNAYITLAKLATEDASGRQRARLSGMGKYDNYGVAASGWLPKGTNAGANGGQELTWQQTFVIVPPCQDDVLGAPNSPDYVKAHIGLYDTDVINDYQSWLSSRPENDRYPMVEIESVSRDDYRPNRNASTAPWLPEAILKFDGRVNSNNYISDFRPPNTVDYIDTHLTDEIDQVNYIQDDSDIKAFEAITKQITFPIAGGGVQEPYPANRRSSHYIDYDNLQGTYQGIFPDPIPRPPYDLNTNMPPENTLHRALVDKHGLPLTVSNNLWENIPYHFDKNKIYKIRFYNIASANYIQFKTPFGFIDDDGGCDIFAAQPIEVKVGLTADCKLYIQELWWQGDHNAQIQIYAREENSADLPVPTATQYSQNLNKYDILYKYLDSSQTNTKSIEHDSWHGTILPPQTNAPLPSLASDNSNLLTELIQPSELLYSSLLDSNANFEIVVSSYVLVDTPPDPNYDYSIFDATRIEQILDSNNQPIKDIVQVFDMNNQPLEIIISKDAIKLDANASMIQKREDCLGYTAKVRVRSCQIRLEDLDVSLPGNVKPRLHLEVSLNNNLVTPTTFGSGTLPAGYVRSDIPQDGSNVVVIDLTQADVTWFNNARNFNFKITGYYDNNNVLQQFYALDAHGNIQLDSNNNPIVVTPDIDASDYRSDLNLSSNSHTSCTPPILPTDCDNPADIHEFSNIRFTTTNGGSTTGSVTSDIAGSSSTNPEDHYGPSHPHPDWKPYPLPGHWGTENHRHLLHTHSRPYLQERSVTDTLDIDFTSYNQLSESFAKQLASNELIGMHEIDTAASETTNASHNVWVKPKFDANRIEDIINQGPNVTKGSNLNSSLNVTGFNSNIDYIFTVRSYKMKPANPGATFTPTRASTHSNNSRLELQDTRSIPNSSIQAYEWHIGWRLEIRETVSYTYNYNDWNVSFTHSSANETNDPRSGSGSKSNTPIRIEGNWKTCSRTMIVEPPECDLTELKSGDTEDFDTEGNGTIERLVTVFPVGEAKRYTELRLTNNNIFGLETNLNNHPVFTIRSSPGLSQPYYDGQSTTVSGSTVDSNTTIRLEPGGDNHLYEESAVAVMYPGKFLLKWIPNWQTDARTDHLWNGTEHFSATCDGITEAYIYIWADPPTCKIERTAFEVGDPQTQVAVKLYNDNKARVNIDSNYTIIRNGLIENQGNVIDSIPAAGNITLFSTPTAIGTSGEYTFNWSITANIGNESWTTLDFPQTPPAQNSWFEDDDERITTTDKNGTNPCEEKLRIAVKPYFKVFHGDVAAGGHFGLNNRYDACADENVIRVWQSDSPEDNTVRGYIAAHSEGDGASAQGSSVKHGVRAHDIIKGFYSASQRPSISTQPIPQPLKGLTLGNTDTNQSYGGEFAEPNCIANYWREVDELAVEDAATNTVTINLDDLANNDRKLYELSRNQVLIITSSGSDLGSLKATIFINGEGNVYIKNNISNNRQAAHWYHPSEIGHITLIVQGNIFIEPDVEEIDAVLVAYPRQEDNTLGIFNDITDGQIWTCYFDGMDQVSHFNRCNKKLTINGAVTAQKVVLGRIHKSVKESLGTPESEGGGNRASEEINLLPEYLIGTPELPIFPDQLYKSESSSVVPVGI